ncbi:MAG: hypothetical protein A2932_00510 [Candidatus Spechtbacteria bacterium RIFCSPLOWO2_01_FULL_46_10]|uniref:Uncharacterized protein n=1 Tax=Candidatus Spechtbacteria bacterium RIFCSPLOWO2_01_FULL_46_10 TaxID=1802163 RepID=A0A1G2HI08_9BACT|nr:MAG: hypothetical protein A2932_00510 [Candidatus Spechtbacteria bacterium RIFCSPLOWO2_01_FULL_46_10]
MAKKEINYIEIAVVLFIALILDFMGAATAALVLVFGVGAFLSIIPLTLGMLTIGLWSWFRAGKLPFTQKLKRKGMQMAIVAGGESITAGLIPGWTVYVLLQLKK